MMNLTNMRQVVYETLKPEADALCQQLKVNPDIEGVNLNAKHIAKRMEERRVQLGDIRFTLELMRRNHICESLYLMSLPEETRPFRIEVRGKRAIILLSRKDNLWTINSVLNPRFQGKYAEGSRGNFMSVLNV